jgi:hypothetical protein
LVGPALMNMLLNLALSCGVNGGKPEDCMGDMDGPVRCGSRPPPVR